MSLHFLAGIVGALAAAAGTGVLVARCLRVPNAALAAWTVAIVGLTISLGAQALGYGIGFGSISFRAMEVGAQLIAPLALGLGLAEVAGKTITQVRRPAAADRGGDRGPRRSRHRPAERRDLHQGMARTGHLLPDLPQQAARIRAGPGHRDRGPDRDRGDRRPAEAGPGLAGRPRPGRRGSGSGPHALGAGHGHAAEGDAAARLAVHGAVHPGRGSDLLRWSAGQPAPAPCPAAG